MRFWCICNFFCYTFRIVSLLKSLRGCEYCRFDPFYWSCLREVSSPVYRRIGLIGYTVLLPTNIPVSKRKALRKRLMSYTWWREGRGKKRPVIISFKMCWKIPVAKRQNSCRAFNCSKNLNLEMKKNAYLVLLVCLWSPQATLDFPFHLLPQHTDSRHLMSLWKKLKLFYFTLK